MSVTTSNYHFSSTGWCNRLMSAKTVPESTPDGANTSGSPNVDDGLTSLSWLQNLNMCMTRLGAPTPPTPPASPVCATTHTLTNTHKMNTNSKTHVSATVESFANTSVPKNHSLFPTQQRDGRSQSNAHPNATSKKSSQNNKNNENETIDYKTNGSVKPPYSYATLICMAMKANKNKMTLSAIYKWIRENFLYYKNAEPSWQNSIRHNLSLNKCFIKIPRLKEEPGKGGFWKLDPVYADTLVDGVFKKRRPSQRGSANSANSNGPPFRKKSRKKDSLRNECQMRRLNEVKGIIANGTGSSDVPPIHDTPPNSTESYNIYGETANDVVELVTAVNSIETVGQCDSYTYTMHSTHTTDGHHLTHPGYGNEICITETTGDTCMLETDGNDICWNAILTDADLNELTNYTTSPVIHTADGSSLTVSDSTTTTAQLTAVEPHSLHLVANASPTGAANGGAIDESELYHNTIVSRHINCLALRPATMGSDVISATQNVVTCVNPTTVQTTDWSHWQTFSTVANTDSTDLLIRQINGNCEPIVSQSPIAYIATTAAPIISRPVVTVANKMTINCVNSGQQSAINSASSATSTQPSSPTSGNFEPTTALQPWAECKAALEAAALDLESFVTLDVHNY